MVWFTLIGLACIIAGLCAVPFLFSLRAVSCGRLPGWNFAIVAFASIGLWSSGFGIIMREPWRFYPLIPSLVAVGVIWLMGAKIHNELAAKRKCP